MYKDPKLVKLFEALVEQHSKMLYSYLVAIVKNQEDAKDLLQEVLIAAYENIESFDSENGNFAAWLRVTGRNMAFNLFRQRKKEVVTDPGILAGIEDVFSGIDNLEGDTWSLKVLPLRQCILELNENLLKVCKYFYMKRMKTQKIADKLNVPQGTILKRLQRGRGYLRTCIEKKLKLMEC